MTTNEFERDVNDTSFLKRPGRVDLRILQNTADCGDGHPGLQRCFRNYLHEGGMEKDLDLIGYSIKGTSVDINNAELQQLSNIGTSIISINEWSQIANIGAATISAAQWGYVGNMDQEIHKGHSPEFAGLTINGNITITGTVDGADVSDLKTAFDTHKGSTGADHTYINQDIKSGASPTFVGLTLSANIVTTSTVDGVNISTFKADYDSKINQNVKNTTSPTFVGLTLSADLVTTSTVDGVDVSDFKTEFEAFNAIGSANAQYIGSVYEHSQDFGQDFNLQQLKFANKGGTGAELMHFSIPLPCNKGPYSLKLDDIILYLTDADGTNRIERLSVEGLQNDSTEDLLFIDETDKTSPQTVTWDLSNLDCSGYWKLVIIVATTSGSTDTIEFAAPIVKYFYS